MKIIAFKVVMFLAAVLFLQGVILPWTISNDVLPVWVDILILSGILMIWVALIDRVSVRIANRIRSED